MWSYTTHFTDISKIGNNGGTNGQVSSSWERVFVSFMYTSIIASADSFGLLIPTRIV